MASSYKVLDSFVNNGCMYELVRQVIEVDPLTDKDIFSVNCWNDEGAEGSELHWEMKGVYEGGKEENGRLSGGVWIPYDEQLARKEFERWR